MKKIYTQILLSFVVLIMALFSGCKKNDYEINSSLIESKLSGDSAQQWNVPIRLTNDGCAGSTTLTLHADHTFHYVDGSCVFDGSWNANYAANRGGQFLNLNLKYIYNFNTYVESFMLKYSSEQDMFYALDPTTQKLSPFVKFNLAP